MTKILTREEARKTEYFGVYENGNYRYNEGKYLHLIRDGKDL